MNARSDIRIPSHGEELAAYFYRPDAPAGEKVPCVVMAHGFTGTRDDGLPGYAEAFQQAGYAVVVFDYRYFGASTGEPRQLLDIGAQQDDYRAVIDWARHADGIDPDRIVLWGSSFSGGHVLVVAEGDPRIAAVIAQAPFADSLAVMRTMPIANMARATALGLADRAGALLGRPPIYMSAVGPPGSFAALTDPSAHTGFQTIVGPKSLWRNEFAARLLLNFVGFRPFRHASKLTMPVLFCVCDEDTTTPPGPAVAAAQAAPHAELRLFPYGHFDIYHDEEAKADQVDFLQRVFDGSYNASD